MIRVSALLALVLLALAQVPAHAGDFPGDPSCKEGEDCTPDTPDQPAPPPAPEQPVPAPGPEVGFCAGTFEGYYLNDPAPVQFEIQQSGRWGELRVTAWWRGGVWYGQGFCRQTNACEAAVEIYFPGAPVHRGVLRQTDRFATLEGRIDFGNFFRLQRTSE